MTGPKHTPGPWHPGHLGSDSTCQCKSVIDEGYAGGICTMHVDNGLRVGEGGNDAPPRDEAIANMHLIAAAPNMLEALKGILSNPGGRCSAAQWEAGLRAVAKAEGRS